MKESRLPLTSSAAAGILSRLAQNGFFGEIVRSNASCDGIFGTGRLFAGEAAGRGRNGFEECRFSISERGLAHSSIRSPVVAEDIMGAECEVECSEMVRVELLGYAFRSPWLPLVLCG